MVNEALQRWISEEVIERTEVLPRVSLAVNSGSNKPHIRASWQPTQDCRFNGGEINFCFAQGVKADATPDWGEPRMVLTAWFVFGSFRDMRPKEGLAILFSALATINQTAILSNGLLHVERSNECTRSSFNRLVRAGIYGYSDRFGHTRSSPMEVEGNQLLRCRYPVEGMEERLEKFVLPGGAEALVQLREHQQKQGRLTHFLAHCFQN